MTDKNELATIVTNENFCWMVFGCTVAICIAVGFCTLVSSCSLMPPPRHRLPATALELVPNDR